MKLRSVPPEGLDVLPPPLPPCVAAVIEEARSIMPLEGFARMPVVLAVTGWSKSTLRRRIREGDFPKAVALGPRVVGWEVGAVRAWIAARAV